MSRISACLIVKNEESILERALQSITPICDEIIVTDTGSTDKTVEIAKKYTDKIYHFEWIDDSSAARNFCEQYANYDFVLRWDADWILHSSGITLIQELKSKDFEGADVVYFLWNSELNEDGTPLTSQANYFLFRNHMFTWQSPIHNRLIARQPGQEFVSKEYLDIVVDHFKDPQVKQHRYAQTLKILEKELTNPKSNLHGYLRPFYIDALMFEKRFEEALAQLQLQSLEPMDHEQLWQHMEKTVRCYLSLGQIPQALDFFTQISPKFGSEPRNLLLHADLQSLRDPRTAVGLYEKYISLLPQIQSSKSLNYERQIVHPYAALSKLYAILNNSELSQKNTQQAARLTRDPNLRAALQNLLLTPG